MMKRAAALIASLAVVALATACESEDPRIGPTPPLTTAAPSSATDAGPVFTGMKACDVLAAAIEGTKLGVPKESKLSGPNGCLTEAALYGTAALDLSDEKRFDDLAVDQGQISTIAVAGRDARLLKGNGGKGTCQISMAAGPNSRALVMLTISDTEQSCRDLQPIAERVAEQLPAS